MKSTDPVISLKGSWLRETDKAVLFSVNEISGVKLEEAHSTWFPFSQIARSVKNPNKLNDDMLVVSQWIADQKNVNDWLPDNSGPATWDEEISDLPDDVDSTYGELDGKPSF